MVKLRPVLELKNILERLEILMKLFPCMKFSWQLWPSEVAFKQPTYFVLKWGHLIKNNDQNQVFSAQENYPLIFTAFNHAEAVHVLSSKAVLGLAYKGWKMASMENSIIPRDTQGRSSLEIKLELNPFRYFHTKIGLPRHSLFHCYKKRNPWIMEDGR